MQIEPLVPLEPPLHVLMFVGGVVVQDQVRGQALGHLGVDGAPLCRSPARAARRQRPGSWGGAARRRPGMACWWSRR
jgi:hypothetical protein